MNDFDINDEFGYDKDYSYLDKVLKTTLDYEKIENAYFSVIFVDEETIKKLNKEYRDIDRVTDVISFAFLDNESVYDPIKILGDIYICIPRMIKQASEYNHSEKRELSFLCVHGLLHLLGYDHTKSVEEEKIMFQKQDEILNICNIKR